MAEQVLSCAVSGDDGYEANGGAVTLNDTDLRLGMPNNNEVAAGFRFPLPSTGWLVDKTVTDVALRLTFAGVNNGSYTAKAYMHETAMDAILVVVLYTASTTNGYRDIYAEDKGLVPATDADPGPPRLVLTYDETTTVDERDTTFLMADTSDVRV